MKDSSKSKQRQIQKRGKNPDTLRKKFGFAWILHLFLNLPPKKGGRICAKPTFFPKVSGFLPFCLNLPPLLGEESFMKSQNCQAGVISWPIKVARPRCAYQRIEGKFQIHHEWPPGRPPQQNFTKIPFLQTFITQNPLFFRPTDFFMSNVEGVAG